MAGETPVRSNLGEAIAADNPWRLDDIVRRRRLREQGERTPD
jgi:hypothetical protein